MRIHQNLQAINAISQKNFSPDILEKYSGFGGIGKELSQYHNYKQLTAIIPKQKIAEIKATTKTAYYTPEFLVKFIYQALSKLGFKGGNILEPSAGTGAFIKHMPKSMRENSKITAIECEPVAYQILKALHLGIKTINSKFEDTTFPNNSFDLVIGNPPYGSDKVKDERNPDLTKTVLTDYFVARGVRLLKKGGILAFVVNQYVLDMAYHHIRDVLAKEGANLLAAYRLPEDVFTGAKVTTDVIFITKGTNTNKWINTKPYRLKNHVKQINEYYINNPQNILGKLDVVTVRDKTHLVCKADSNLADRLSKVLKTFPSNAKSISTTKYNKACNSNLDFESRVNNYVNTIISKYWDSLLKKINLKRNKFLSDELFLHINKPKITLQEIKSSYSINYDNINYDLFSNNNNGPGCKDILVETPLDKSDYYFEINLTFNSKNKIIYHDMINIESTIEIFLKDVIRDKFKHRVFFHYENS